MSVSEFIVLFSFLSTITGLCVEASKKIVPNTTRYNETAITIGVIVGFVGTCFYYMFTGTTCTTITIISAICMGFGCALGSMVGYDKIKQLLAQINGGK